jgi:nucleoside phosphorylase
LLAPSTVMMVGIAFGVDPDKQRVGDILVAERLLDYELQRVGQASDAQNILPRGDKVSVSARLLNRCRDTAMEWREAGEAGNVQFGLLLSGAKLVDNVRFREQLRSFAPEAIGGEMEGAGLYAAVAGNKVDWILVKAISDWADGKKAEDKQACQELAATRAARFVLRVIQQGGLREEEGERQSLAQNIQSVRQAPTTPAQSSGAGSSSALACGRQSVAIGRDNTGSITISSASGHQEQDT